MSTVLRYFFKNAEQLYFAEPIIEAFFGASELLLCRYGCGLSKAACQPSYCLEIVFIPFSTIFICAFTFDEKVFVFFSTSVLIVL